MYHDFNSLSHTDSSDFERVELAAVESLTYRQDWPKKAASVSALVLKYFALVNIEAWVVALWVNS